MKVLNVKQIFGAVIFLIGIAGVIYAIYNTHRLAEAKKDISGFSKFISGTAGDIAEDIGMSQTKKYDTQLTWLWIGSIALVIVGGGVVYFCRKKKS